MILLVCPCCGQEADEFYAPGLYINARLSTMSDILTTEAAMGHLSKKDKDCAQQKERLAGLRGRRQAPVGVRGQAPEGSLPAGEAGFQGRPEPLSASQRGVEGGSHVE